MAALALQSTLRGDAPGIDRALVWVYAAGAAGLNLWHADSFGGLRAALFYGAASMSAALVWERTLRAIRRDDLRKRGAIDAPAPRFRPSRWLLHTRETWGAFKTAVWAGVSDSRTAIALYRMQCEYARLESEAVRAWQEIERTIAAAVEIRGELPDVSQDSNRVEPAAVQASSPRVREPKCTEQSGESTPSVAAELEGLTKSDALRYGWRELGAIDVPWSLEWLAVRGVVVDKSQAYAVAPHEGKRRAERQKLEVVAGESAA